MNPPDYQYALLGAIGAIFLILLFQLVLVKAARRRAKTREIRFMDLIITDDDESYSLYRLQMYLWTVSIIIGFSAVFAAKLEIPDIPANLYMLMGVNLAAAVTSTAITTFPDLMLNHPLSVMPLRKAIRQYVITGSITRASQQVRYCATLKDI